MNHNHKKISISKQNSKLQSILLSYKGKKITLSQDDPIDMIRLYNEFGLDFHFETTNNPKILKFESNNNKLYAIKSYPISIYFKMPEKGLWSSFLDKERIEIKDSIVIKIEKHEFLIEKEKTTKDSNSESSSCRIDEYSSNSLQACTRSQSRVIMNGSRNQKLDLNKRKTRSSSRNISVERSNTFEEIFSQEKPRINETSTLRRSKTSIDQDKYSEKASLSTSQETSHEENYFRGSSLKKVKKNEDASKVKCSNLDQIDGKCPICLSEFSKDIGRLDSCAHIFCYNCILEWSALASECPLCKSQFLKLTKSSSTGQIKDTVKIKVKKFHFEESLEDLIDPNSDDHCYVCNGRDDLEHMIICDKCSFKCCHIYCCDPPLESIPLEDWYCKDCIERPRRRNNNSTSNNNAFGYSNINIDKSPSNNRRNERSTKEYTSPPRKHPKPQIQRSYTTRSNNIAKESKSTPKKNRYPLRSQTFDLDKFSK